MSSPPHDQNPLPPLSPSILGVEPLDEFIKEVAEFIHGMILRAPEYGEGKVEVEAKIGVIRDRQNQRLQLPVLVETSMYITSVFLSHLIISQQCSNQIPSISASSRTCPPSASPVIPSALPS
jgi:hypothetical protein